MNEAALLEQWRGGDQRAGNELFEHYFPAVYRFFVNKTRSQADTDELTQATFVGLIEARDRYKGGAFLAYTLGIAANVLRRYYRDLRRDEARYDLLTTSIIDIGVGVRTQLECAEVQEIFVAALRAVPADYQLVLELAYVEELEASTIAETLGIADNTVRSRLSRGRDELRSKVRELADERSTILPPEDEWARMIKSAFPTHALAGALGRRR